MFARFKKILCLFGFWLSLSICVLGFGFAYLFAIYRSEVPNFHSVEDYKPRVVSQVFASDGRLIGEFAKEKRIVVAQDDISTYLRQALIAAEDKNFREHDGIDFLGMGNAFLEKVLGMRKRMRGASTITQQLAKSILVEEEGFKSATKRSIKRKFKEAILARRLEASLTKDDIIWMYLNHAYFGRGSYGAQAASLSYFSKSAKDLSIDEAAILAGLLQAPSRYSPLINPKSAKRRQRYVLHRMYEEGYISKAESELAKNKKIIDFLKPQDNYFKSLSPYFTEHVRRYVLEQYGERSLYEDGLKIYTTLDLDRDLAAKEAVQKGLRYVDKRQGYRGPLKNLSNPKDWQNFIELSQSALSEEGILSPHNLYLVLVTELDLEKQVAKIAIGHKEGVLPLAGMGWARPVNPAVVWHEALAQSVGAVLSVGDVIWVSPVSKQTLLSRTSTGLAKRKLRNLDGDVALFALEQEPVVEGALISMAPKTGYVESMIGGYDFESSEFNRAYQACRQPGSIFKPITYSAAIAIKNYTPASLILDAPLTFRWNEAGLSWKPKNFGKDYEGEVTLRQAIMHSMNVPTINISRSVGVKNIVNWAYNLGVETKLKRELGTAIGSSCVSPYELAKVYSTFASLGERKDGIFIKRVLDREGDLLEESLSHHDVTLSRQKRVEMLFENKTDENGSKNNRAMTKADAYMTNYLLKEVVNYGTGRRAKGLNKVLAGKTGTTNDSYDTWFAGFTPNLATVVWVGYDHMKIPLAKYEQGARTALPIWLNYMTPALKKTPNEKWPVPEDICFAYVDKKLGTWVEDESINSVQMPFLCGAEPIPHELKKQPSFLEALNAPGGL